MVRFSGMSILLWLNITKLVLDTFSYSLFDLNHSDSVSNS